MVGRTDLMKLSKFFGCIQSTIFCRVGNIYYTGHDHMIPVAILLPGRKERFYIFCAQFSRGKDGGLTSKREEEQPAAVENQN